MSNKIRRCDRCGRRYRGQEDWNVIYRAGVVVAHRCPDCQTPEDHAEAVIREATTDYSTFKEVRPGDPDWPEAMTLHIKATADGVWRDFLQGIVDSGQGAAADPYALADELLRRLAQTMGQPKEGSDVRDDMADMFREMLDGLTGGDA